MKWHVTLSIPNDGIMVIPKLIHTKKGIYVIPSLVCGLYFRQYVGHITVFILVYIDVHSMCTICNQDVFARYISSTLHAHPPK